jgi:acyl-CoA hydrolase
MKHYKLVLPEFMNEQEALFGGNLLKWIDEFAYVTVSLDYPGNRFVTVSLDNVVFRKPIKVGYILCFNVMQSQLGNTSVGYQVKVFNAKEDAGGNNLLFETRIVFVNVDKTGKKQKIKNSKRITESRKA